MKLQGRRGTRHFDSSRVRTLFLLVAAAALGSAGAVLPAFGTPAAPVSQDPHLLLQTPAPTGRIIVKFVESSGLTVENGRLKPQLADADHARIESLLDRLASAHGPLRLERHFTRSPEEIDQDRRSGQRRLGRALPNLNRYARIVPDLSLTRAALLEIVSELIADPSVETAFLEPVAVPAALGFDAFTGKFDPGQTAPLDPGQTSRGADHFVPAGSIGAPLSPDFSGLQLYLDPAPAGVNAEGVWGVPGGAGQSVKVIDIEGAWLWTHEDLPAPFFTAGTPFNDQSWRNHGTAVMGEMRGVSNTLGVTGIAYQCQVGAVSVAEMSVADAINTAAAHLDEGDVFLIELHSPGPNATGEGQFGYVCMEYWLDIFEAIQIATANGRICCEAAGNGQQNLDDPIYAGLFDRDVRDSGAIICGASSGQALDPAWFTNYGARVDLHGWGGAVVSTGYGTLQGGAETEWYTNSFSGTSSASPIVTGSVMALQGMVKAAFGIPLDAKLARDILVATGTPQNGTQHIGPRPNLTAAWAEAQSGIGAVAGTVTHSGSGTPIDGVSVSVLETGAHAATGADGSYAVPLQVGDYTLVFEEFFSLSETLFVSISSGSTTPLDVALTAAPTVEIGGSTLGGDGHTKLAGVRVSPLDEHFAATVSDPDGDWSIAGFPEGHSYGFSFDGLPGFGADYEAIDIGAGRSQYGLYVQLPGATATFETDNGGFSGDAIWAHGTPTAGGPFAGFSGTKCWGVGMFSDYGDMQHGYLTSPSYDFSDEQELRLSFHYWCETETDYDGAAVDVWDAAGSAWVRVTPLTGYTSAALGGIGYQNGWSGSTGGWVGTVFDITPYISSQVAFRVEFGSDQGVTGLGFWVDDIAFDTGDTFSSIDPPEAQGGIALFARGPNPFSGTTRLALTLPAPQEIDLAVYDPAGRRVRTLVAGSAQPGVTEIGWDGRDDEGQILGSGIYFARMRTKTQTLLQKLILAQ